MISNQQTIVSKIDHSKPQIVKTDNTDNFMQKRSNEKLQVKKADFLDKLRSITYSGNITMVCQALGFSRSQVYKWRDEDPDFGQEWDWAIKESFETRVDETAGETEI